MNTVLLAWNPDTRRCHGVRPDSAAKKYPELLIKITRVPKTVTLPEVCVLVEHHPEIRHRRKGMYEDLCVKSRRTLRKAG